MEELLNISPVDGRYEKNTEKIRNYFSEIHLMKNRILVEIEWLKTLSTIPEIGIKLKREEQEKLEDIIHQFDLIQGQRVKEIEATTKHDVKAVEYYINERLKELNLEKLCSFVHFACTSEDINNIAYGIMEQELLEKVFLPEANQLLVLLKEKAHQYSKVSMLSHTHGQNATPTTVGKEFANFVHRLRKNCG